MKFSNILDFVLHWGIWAHNKNSWMNIKREHGGHPLMISCTSATILHKLRSGILVRYSSMYRPFLIGWNAEHYLIYFIYWICTPKRALYTLTYRSLTSEVEVLFSYLLCHALILFCYIGFSISWCLQWFEFVPANSLISTPHVPLKWWCLLSLFNRK